MAGWHDTKNERDHDMRKNIETNLKMPGALNNVMQESQNGCQRNNPRAGEEKELTVA